MKDKIAAILEREIAKLDALSLSYPEPLSPAGVKSLDVLIRAFRAFVDPAPLPADSPKKESDPASHSTDDLVNALLSEPKEPVHS